MVETRLGREKREKIQQSIAVVPPQLRFLTIIRKLSHLSRNDWQAGVEETTAMDIIEDVGRTTI
jgi:hypothetical protein